MERKKIAQIKADEIEVNYNGKKVVINLTEELSINENIINSQLKEMPSNYLFLSLLRDKAVKVRNSVQAEADEAYAKAWLFYKESDSRLNNDTVTKKAETNPKYLSILKRLRVAEDKANKLISACKAYESRERILQTISANTRKQI